MSKDEDFVTLTKAYEKLNAEIKASIIAAAESVGQTDFGYQWSPELTLAGQMVQLWKAVLPCVLRNTELTEKPHNWLSN